MNIPVQIIAIFFTILLAIFGYIFSLTNQVGELKGRLNETDLKQLKEKYNDLKELLEKVESDKQIENAKTLLNLLANNNNEQANIILNKIDEIEKKQKSQPIIKIGRYAMICGKNTPQELYKGDGTRLAEFTAEFGYTFDKKPEVFVALAMIDTDSRKHTRVSVYVKENKEKEYLIDRDKFTFVVKTWENSIVYGVNVVWIAFGK